MILSHKGSLLIMKKFLDELPHHNGNRALEVAAGDGRVTKDFLKDKYKVVDCFDQCPLSVEELEKLRSRYQEIDLVDQASMQNYIWSRQYSAIYLRWCIGYLNDLELIAFLKNAGAHLESTRSRSTRNSNPSCFIFVFDNILEDLEIPEEYEGQYVRRKEKIEEIFGKAGLIIHKFTEKQELHQDYRSVIMWALY